MTNFIETIKNNQLDRAKQQIEATLITHNIDIINTILELGKVFYNNNKVDFSKENTFRIYRDLDGFMVSETNLGDLANDLMSMETYKPKDDIRTHYIDLRYLNKHQLNQLKLLLL